eukprot:3476380-Rhodomonas_salina.2
MRGDGQALPRSPAELEVRHALRTPQRQHVSARFQGACGCKDSPAIFLWTRNLPGSAAGARDATIGKSSLGDLCGCEARPMAVAGPDSEPPSHIASTSEQTCKREANLNLKRVFESGFEQWPVLWFLCVHRGPSHVCGFVWVCVRACVRVRVRVRVRVHVRVRVRVHVHVRLRGRWRVHVHVHVHGRGRGRVPRRVHLAARCAQCAAQTQGSDDAVVRHMIGARESEPEHPDLHPEIHHKNRDFSTTCTINADEDEPEGQDENGDGKEGQSEDDDEA